MRPCHPCLFSPEKSSQAKGIHEKRCVVVSARISPSKGTQADECTAEFQGSLPPCWTTPVLEDPYREDDEQGLSGCYFLYLHCCCRSEFSCADRGTGNGHEFADLTATDLHQMIGRAGRRGKDNIGFALVVPGIHQDPHLIQELRDSPSEPLISRIRINFSMTLNLLLSHTPMEVKDLLDSGTMGRDVKGTWPDAP